MRRVFAALALAFVLLASKSAAASFPIDLSGAMSQLATFEKSLEPHGTWESTARWGSVWVPSLREVGIDFVPYSRGKWVLDGDGWLWQSAYSWGAITDHYGRWVLDDIYGWAWVPGTDWAPANVAWRSGDGLIGWAPLGPEDRAPPDAEAWSFVSAAAFAAGMTDEQMLPPLRTLAAFGKTSPIVCGAPSPLYALGLQSSPCQVRRAASAGLRRVNPDVVSATEASNVHAKERRLLTCTPRIAAALPPERRPLGCPM